MKSKKNFLALSVASLFTAIGLGFTKFFAYEHLVATADFDFDRGLLIQAVGGIMTLGPILAYVISGALAQRFQKGKVMSVSLLILLGISLVWQLLSLPGSPWVEIFIVGLMVGVHSAGKLACIPFVASEMRLQTVTVNAILSVLFVVGMISGLVTGAEAYHMAPDLGLMTAVGIFVIALIASFLVSVKGDSSASVKGMVRELPITTVSLLLRYPVSLLASTSVWGIAGAGTLSLTALVGALEIADSASECAMMSLWAALGAMLGNAISPRVEKKRYFYSALAVLGVATILFLIPFFILIGFPRWMSHDGFYLVLSIAAGVMGVFFGFATNILDAEVLEKSKQEGCEGKVAALQSAMISFFSTFFGLLNITMIWVVAHTFQLREGALFSMFLPLAISLVPAIVCIMASSLHRGEGKDLFVRLMFPVIGFMLSLRYRLKIEGMDKINISDRGILFLPNHPALIDPVILSYVLWKKYRIRPVIDESMYDNPVIRPLARAMKAFRMPDMTCGGGWLKQVKIEEELNNAAKALKEGDNVLMYPAGHLMNSGREDLGANSGTKTLLEQATEARPVLVSTRGLWGSSFSRRGDDRGYTPNLQKTYFRAFKAILVNGLFFLPRREVQITFRDATNDFPRKENSSFQNRWMEAFFNRNGEESVNRVSWGLLGHAVQPNNNAGAYQEKDYSTLSEEIKKAVIRETAKMASVHPSKVDLNSRLDEDLGLDSINRAELLAWLSDLYGCGEVPMDAIHTVGDIGLIAERGNEDGNNLETKLQGWSDKAIEMPEVTGQTLPEAFLNLCKSKPETELTADGISGKVYRRRDMLIFSLMIANWAKKTEGRYIGILLPAGPAAMAAVMGCLISGKVPIMLNWTTGRKNLKHCLGLCKTDKVLSSSGFLERLRGVELDNLYEKLCFLEDIHRSTEIADKIELLWQSRKGVGAILKMYGGAIFRQDSEAVVLFTSGSENKPKGVPLTHRNLMSNIRDCFCAAGFVGKDVILGVCLINQEIMVDYFSHNAKKSICS